MKDPIDRDDGSFFAGREGRLRTERTDMSMQRDRRPRIPEFWPPTPDNRRLQQPSFASLEAGESPHAQFRRGFRGKSRDRSDRRDEARCRERRDGWWRR